ncbi:MAG: (d)CMP kinase [Lachnospiraceae bacterium]|nr:(d)CMP kinase [Lachnospiraceae bacterium]
MQIAIDGPAGAGKSTIAKLVAKNMGFIYVDTGAMYRAMALYLMRSGFDTEKPESAAELVKDADISLKYENGEQVVLIGDENVNSLIRTPEVSQMASVTSAIGDVRKRLVALQQELAAKESVVMDGRDIGSVVLPNAEVKVYLTASVECRAKRRYDEMTAKGETCDLEETKKDIEERDYRDMHRENSPLVQAEGAVLVDSSDMTIDEVVNRIMELVKTA